MRNILITIDSSDPTAIIALIINTTALVVVIWQLYIGKKTLNSTQQSIDAAKTERQLEILPKMNWVVYVQLQLKSWREDLVDKQTKIQIVLDRNLNRKENNDIYINSKDVRVINPKDLNIDKHSYDNTPAWLREILMSGAQYYYDAVAPMQHLSQNGSYGLAEDIRDSCVISREAIDVLEKYIKDMVPSVILNTPASLSDSVFLRD